MATYVETGTKTFTAGAAIGQHLRVTLTAGKLAAAGSTTQEIGTLLEASFADLDIRTVRLRTAQGTCKMVAAGAITLGNPVYAASSGKIDASGTVLLGIALEASTANNDIIEILRRQETSDSAASGGTTGAAFLVDSDATTPKIELAAQTGGTGDYKATIKPPATLSGNQVLTLPAANDTVAVLDLAQTFTNKTLTTPTITFPTATVVVGGTAIGNANAVTQGFTLVTGANDTAAVKLPEAAAGVWVKIKNGVANKILCVFPAVNDQINNTTANSVYNIGNGGYREFVATNAVSWWTDPEVIV